MSDPVAHYRRTSRCETCNTHARRKETLACDMTTMTDPTNRRCPKCGARLKVERVDHHLGGNERLLCPQHGTVGRLDDDRRRGYGRYREEFGEAED